ncbi:MAG: hypothetical protein JKX84_09655 [Flavobacteriales bacterium]|nr:hypothetical protein [Flavobacteriales bacterium]
MTPEQLENERVKQNGFIDLKDDKVIRTFRGEVLAEILVSEIKVIGEFTTADGPYIDDWFITIMTKDHWYELPMYAIGMDEVLTELSRKLNAPLQTKFVNSTEWKTRVMYPVKLEGKALYDWVDLEPKSIWERFRELIGFQKSIRRSTSEVNQILDYEHRSICQHPQSE